GVGPAPFDRGIRELVGAPQIASHAVLAGQVAVTARWELAGDPPLRAVDAWLVDRAPHADQVAKLVRYPAHERHESPVRTGCAPSPFSDEPQRTRKVVQGDHRHQPALAHLAEHVPVVADLPGVEDALGRFYTRPLHREPVRVLVELAQEGKVVAVAVVVIAGHR